MRAFTPAVLLLAFLVAPISSQSVDKLCPSQLVHWRAAGHMVEGWLVAPADAGKPLQVEQAGVKGTKELGWDTPSLACYEGKGRRGDNVTIPLFLGLMIGGAIGYTSGDDTGSCFVMCKASEKAMAGAMGFGLAGAVIGAISSPGSVWTPLKSGSGTRRVGLVVNGHGVGVGVRF